MTRHILPATPETVRVGVIDQAFPPVLSVESGDEVVFETWQLWGNAVRPDTTIEEVLAVRQRHAGRGPHSITGPVEIRGARPGSALRVDILELEPVDHGFNLIPPAGTSRGLLAERFSEPEIRHFRLDTRTMTTRLGDLVIPLRPFLGVMGVAPARPGPHHSAPPGPFGGNIDCPDLIAGTTLFLPVWVDGARFYVGDAHACQGCGEVTQTALETAMRAARLRLSVVEDLRIERPRAETLDHLVTMGFSEDLRAAAQQAVGDMVDWLAAEQGLTPGDAYTLCSLAADLLITQAVNGTQGVHARLPKAVLARRARA